MNPQHLYELVAPELAQVEEELREYTHSSVRTISEIGEYILKGGGKRIRPMLLLLTSRMIGEITRARSGSRQSWSSSTMPRSSTTTSSMLRTHGAAGPPQTRHGETP